MNWDRETKIKMASEIRRVSLETEEEVFSQTKGNFPQFVEKTLEKIRHRLEPLGFEPANKDWKFLEEHQGIRIYQDSPTHLWFETAQARMVKIEKSLAERVLVLGIP